MTAERMDHERRISALEASYQHLATKADVEAVRAALLWLTTVIGLVGLILSRPG